MWGGRGGGRTVRQPRGVRGESGAVVLREPGQVEGQGLVRDEAEWPACREGSERRARRGRVGEEGSEEG